ncbi:MAG: molybdopterin-dependent oxidoreductase [Dehalococcoidia bacterium]|nr:molybdopterin-dependent oxidoreductase [Dehalococcoidia bacterium]
MTLSIVGDVQVGFPAVRTGYGQQTYGNTSPQVERYTWLTVGDDGRVTLFAGKVEYGQNIRTGLAVEVADELRVGLDDVDVVLGDTDRVPWDMGTFGSQSTARVGWQLRKAAATARETLIALGADHLDLPASDLEARDGRVISKHDPARGVDYAALLEGDPRVEEIAERPAVTPSGEWSVMGQTHRRRLDGLDRVTGRAKYSQDIQPEGMLFATVVRPPAYGGRARSVDPAPAEALPSVVSVVREDGLIAVLAEDDEAAALGARMVQVDWEIPSGQPSRWDMPAHLVESGTEPYPMHEAGDLDEGFRQADHILESTYYLPYIAPAPMEPRATVAQWEGDRLTVWAGTQRPFGLRQELASIFGIDESAVHVIAPEIGGGFGAKSPYALAHDAARLARIAGRPVRIAFTRAEEMMWSNFRPSALIQIKSGFTSDGRLVAWQSDAYHSGERVMIGRRGAETPYDAGNVRSLVYRSDSPLPSGSYRSLGAAVNHFAREVHMDEIAEAVGKDPVELRLHNLSEPRFRRVLEQAAEEFGWSGPHPAEGRGAGIALGIDVGSYVATAVEVSVAGREVRVHRVGAALDCGQVVNPEGALNQMEGSIVMGLGGALFEASDFQDGRLLNASFARYRVPRITDAPRIDVRLIGDPETPSTGAGEPGIVPIGAAISGAVFAATGVRHRELPILRHL